MTHSEYLSKLKQMSFRQYKNTVDRFNCYSALGLMNVPEERGRLITDEMIEKAYEEQKGQAEKMKEIENQSRQRLIRQIKKRKEQLENSDRKEKEDDLRLEIEALERSLRLSQNISKIIPKKLEEAYRRLKTQEGREEYAKLCEDKFIQLENNKSASIAVGSIFAQTPGTGKMRLISPSSEQIEATETQSEGKITIKKIVPKQEDTVEKYKARITENFRQQIRTQPSSKSNPRKRELTEEEIKAKSKFKKDIEKITLNPNTWKNNEEER